MLFCDLFWNPSWTNFMEMKSVMDNVLARTISNLQLPVQFIDGHPSVVKNQSVDLYNAPFSHQCGWVPWLFISVTGLNMSINSYTLWWDKTLSYCAGRMWLISVPLMPSAYKNLNSHCSSLMHLVSGALILTLVMKDKWQGQIILPYNNREILHLWLHVNSAVRPTIKEIKTLWILLAYPHIILPVGFYDCETWPLTLKEQHRLRVFEKGCWGEYFNLDRWSDRRLEKDA
jgi:hypothetical protein